MGDPATGLPIGSSEKNLAAAIAGETHVGAKPFCVPFPLTYQRNTPKCIPVWQRLLDKRDLMILLSGMHLKKYFSFINSPIFCRFEVGVHTPLCACG